MEELELVKYLADHTCTEFTSVYPLPTHHIITTCDLTAHIS